MPPVQPTDLLVVQRGQSLFKVPASAFATAGAGAAGAGGPTVKPDWNAAVGSAAEIVNRPLLASIATSGRYTDLIGAPAIPPPYVLPPATGTTLGGVKGGGVHVTIQADGTISANLPGALIYRGVIDATANGPTSAPGMAGIAAGDTYINNTDGVATAAWTGLTGQAVKRHALIVFDGTNWQEAGDIGTAIKPDWNAAVGGINEILNRPNLHAVATSGSYTDLINRPQIPGPYTLPAATETALGGVMVPTHSGLTVNSTGQIQVDIASLPALP